MRLEQHAQSATTRDGHHAADRILAHICPMPDTTTGTDAVPEKLYKYRSLRDGSKKFTRDLIVHQRLYFPSPSELNDPFECRPTLAVKASLLEQKRHFEAIVAREHPHLSRVRRRGLVRDAMSRKDFKGEQVIANAVNNNLGRIGIYSLSAKPLDLLMWPHYADDHRGVCVEFDFQALVDALYPLRGSGPLKVRYAIDRPRYDPVRDPQIEIMRKGVLTKGDAWAYEDEWRIPIAGGAKQVVEIDSPVITGVILGARIGISERVEVLGWVRSRESTPPVRQARFSEDRYELELEDVSL